MVSRPWPVTHNCHGTRSRLALILHVILQKLPLWPQTLTRHRSAVRFLVFLQHC
ncbi:MAG: hypothetical protein GPOALKHO_000049 [Sodalis sp.]|nr:MAG: hypothetical protein GPOALKHO_000049 [Sodalis sp.]